MNTKIMVVDDDQNIQLLLRTLLEAERHEVLDAKDAAELQARFAGPQPDVVLLDLQLPDAHGLDLLPLVKRQWPDTEVIILTGNATIEVAVEATKRGAFWFVPKPFDSKTLMALVRRAYEHKELADQAGKLRQALAAMTGGGAPVFQSPSMKNVVRIIERIAPSDASILITGESGVGKEVITDLVHALSNRSRGPILKVNCAALPSNLIEAELFGYKKGSFTGALNDRAGLFREAEGGTLMLDEISEMPIDTQSKLLRVLQEKEVRPVGDSTSRKVDVRVVAATNRDPKEAIEAGKLRQDLFYRVSAISVDIPPLRERPEDILALANSFLQRFAAQANRPIRGFTPAAQDALRKFAWPGNVRQLQNEIQRAVLMTDAMEIDVRDLSITASLPATSEDEDNLTIMEGIERNAIVQMLKETGGNKVEAAKRLGIGRQTLYNKMRAYNIPM